MIESGARSEGITTIDLGYRSCPRCVAAFLVRTSEGPVLVECGPASCIDALRAGIEAAGTTLEEINHLFLTHIHLDHAGATGTCTRAGATAHVHERGARHLIDPTQLMASATRVFGDALKRDLGALEQSDESRIDSMNDNDRVKVGDATFTALETPGHARHHHAWLMETGGNRHLFSGDVAGMCLPGTRFATLPLVAPELDPPMWLQSIDRIRSVDADALWLTHFGLIERHGDFLDHVEHRLRSELQFVEELIKSQGDQASNALLGPYRAWHTQEARKHGVDIELLDLHCTDQHYQANLAGVGRWIEKRP